MTTNLGRYEVRGLRRFRQLLHAYPEVSAQERETAKRIYDWLTYCEPDFIATDIGGHGLLAGFDMGAPGPSIMFRADMDALPIPDKITTHYASRHPGVGHKCGHDGHAAIQAGMARLMSERPFNKGQVWILFQPAEETGAGAAAVLDDAFFESHRPDWVFGLHNLPGFPLGQILTRDEVFAVASVGLRLDFEGQTAHAAHPLQANSPAGALSALASSWYAVPHPRIDADSWVLQTITHMKLGEPTFGTTPGIAVMQCTLRADRDQALERYKQRMLGQAQRVADSFGLKMHYDWKEAFPVTRNHQEAVTCIRQAATQAGLDQMTLPNYFRWSEDFGHYTRHFPGAFFGLGSGIHQPPLHHMTYDFPDDAIPYGMATFHGIAQQILNS